MKALEEELEKSKKDFKNLETHFKNSSCKCDTLICENLKKKVHYLVNTVDKLSKGKSNFENVLASQNCVFGKAGLGFNPQNKQDKCTALVVGYDDVASCYSVGVLTRRQVGRKEGSREVRVVASC